MMNKQMSSTEAFFCMKSTTWKCKYILSHYRIGLHDSSIQTDMFWAKTKWTYVQKKRNLFPQGDPALFFCFLIFFVSEEKSN